MVSQEAKAIEEAGHEAQPIHVNKLHPNDWNPNVHTEETFESLKQSVKKAGTYQVKIGELSKTLNVKKPEKAGKGLPWALIGGIIVALIAISAFTLYRRK